MDLIKNIETLLSQVKTISKSYEILNEANGGNFNIFSILQIENDEVRTHSRFIAQLLNPKGVHGFKDRFLKLFIKTLAIEKLKNINTQKCQVFVEEQVKDCRMDILIRENNSDENVIMIENKVYAREQEKQLLRYHKCYPKGQLLFLTLFGNDSEQESSKDKYDNVSYKDDIVIWLEKCRELAVTNPTLRETLTQYINLIKKLTNQLMDKVMNEEIVKLFTENKENFKSLIEIKNIDLKEIIIEKTVIPAFEELEKEIPGFQFNKNKEFCRFYSLCWVDNEQLREKNLKILFEFEKSNADFLIGGFIYFNQDNKDKHDYTKLQETFKSTFNGIPKKNNNDYWSSYFHYWYFMNWDSNMEDVKNLIFGHPDFGTFKENIKDKIEKMLGMLDKVSF